MGDILKDKLGNLTNKVKVGFVGTCEKYYTEDSTYPMIRTTNLKNSGVDLSDLKYVTKDFFDKNKKSQLNDGDVLVARFGTSGNACVYHGGPAQCLNAIIIEPNFEVTIPEFLALEINSRHVRNEVNRRIVGSTQNILNTKVLADIEISVPGLPEQARILKNVEKIEEIIQKRKKEIGLLDQIIKARFVEMFDDCKSPLKTVEELCSDIVDCPHTTPKYTGKLKNPAIRTSEIKKGYITWDSMRYVSDEEYEERVSRLRPETGDIVYGREGTFGNAAILPEGYKFCLGQRVMLLRPDYTKCSSEYLLHAVISDDVYRQAVGKNNASTVAHVNVKDVKQFKIPLPSFDKQNQFATFVHQVDKSKAQVQKSLNETQLLFDSLMQKYFG